MSHVEVRRIDPRPEPAVGAVVRTAFGGDEEYELIEALRDDPAWVDALSLGAFVDGELAGHVLLTRAAVAEVAAALLAPLAVAPESQGCGVGGVLVRAGLAAARDEGFEIALVLGHPSYYPRFGFEPALPHGIEPPYPIDPPEAWMVTELAPGALARARGPVAVAAAFDSPELWRE